jgi:hypothetical protein
MEEVRGMGDRTGRMIFWIVAALACAAIQGGVTEADAAEPPAYLSSFGPDGSESTTFEQPGPIAVDQVTHNVYVRDAGALYKFDIDGQPVDFGGSASYIDGNKISGLVTGGQGDTQVAVDSVSHTIYVTSGNSLRAFQANGEPALFAAGPGAGTSEITGFTQLMGVAVDVNGAIYASDYGFGGSGAVKIYAPSGEQITEFAANTPGNLAVDTNGAVYVSGWPNAESTIRKYTPSSPLPVTSSTTYTTPSEPINSRFSYSLAVNPGPGPGTNDLYVAEHSFQSTISIPPAIAWYDEAGTLLARFPEPGEEGDLLYSEGVGIDAESGRVFVSRNGRSLVGIFGPEPKCEEPPVVVGTSVDTVTATSAILRARINPCSPTAPTKYRFEYGTEPCPAPSCTSVPIGDGLIGPGHKAVTVSQSLSTLNPSTTYHFRVVAERGGDVRESPSRTFTTQASGLAFQLTDSRVWEMVSPPNKQGGDILASQGGTVKAAASGNAIAYLTRGSIEKEPEGNRALELSSALAERGADGRWASKDITAPHTEATKIQLTGEYKLFSTDLGRAALEPRDFTPLSPEASEITPYLRTDTEPPTFDPLVNPSNVEPGLPWGGPPAEGEFVTIAGANSDLTHVGLSSHFPLVPGAEPRSIYLWAGGELHVVSELPADEGGGVAEALLGSGATSVRNAISADGRRVFWSLGDVGAPVGLYLRDVGTGQSVRLDVPQPGASELGAEEPYFQGASADGSTVFFTDAQQLTADASPSGSDLYRCEIGETGCATLTNISAPPSGSGESAGVMGVVAALDDQGVRAYFVAGGVLADNEGPGGESAVAGEPNLYLWEEDEGIRFIATLSDGSAEDLADGDAPNWGMGNSGNEQPSMGELTAAGSPDGRYFSFMSERSLTGYDNVNPTNDEALEEVFVYDALDADLTCVSCMPSNAASKGRELPQIATGKTPTAVNLGGLWASRWVAATLPQPALRTLGGASFYHPRAVLNNGRVFFNAVDPLVAADSNAEWDAYQFEPLGVGSCTMSPSSSAVARAGDGCVGLISSGTAEGESAFIDASVSGDDVFFMTRGRLSVLDEDEAVDIYDARVNGIRAKRQLVTECAGENCQPLGAPPNDPTPASAAFNGPGNVKAAGKKCPKGKRKVRRKGTVRCVPRKQRKANGQGGRSNRGGEVRR